MNSYRSLKQQSLAIALLFILATWIGVALFDPWFIVPITAALGVTGIAWRLYRALHRQIGEQQFAEFRQLEALTGLYGSLDIGQPLPRTRKFAASPDFLHLLAGEIFRLKPGLIVELGSGTSTLIAAYCLKKIGRGRVVSLDHIELYADISRQAIESHGLAEFAEVINAPLKRYEIDGETYRWYDDTELAALDGIEVLIVDGPPHDVSKWARYPALPLLRDRLDSRALLLLDDGDRPDETAIVAAWERKYGIECRAEPAEKGAFICRLAGGGE